MVAGEASDGREAVRLATQLRPDLVLLDLRMPGGPGLPALREISRLLPLTRTLVLTADAGDSEVVEALQLGARGVVLKHSPPEMVFKSIRSVAAGEYWVGRERVADLIAMMRKRESWSALTRAVSTGSGLAVSSARATPRCSATSPRTASRNSSQTGSASGITSTLSSAPSTRKKPMSTPSGTAQLQAGIAASPAAVQERQTTSVNETSPSGISSSR